LWVLFAALPAVVNGALYGVGTVVLHQAVSDCRSEKLPARVLLWQLAAGP
jgi:hypothetical protein